MTHDSLILVEIYPSVAINLPMLAFGGIRGSTPAMISTLAYELDGRKGEEANRREFGLLFLLRARTFFIEYSNILCFFQSLRIFNGDLIGTFRTSFNSASLRGMQGLTVVTFEITPVPIQSAMRQIDSNARARISFSSPETWNEEKKRREKKKKKKKKKKRSDFSVSSPHPSLFSFVGEYDLILLDTPADTSNEGCKVRSRSLGNERQEKY